MSASPSKLLIDSNVWIDLFTAARPGHSDARRLAECALEREIALLYAAASIKDTYYVLGESAKRSLRAAGAKVTEEKAAAINEYAWGCVCTMEEFATIVPIDQSDVWIATKYRPLHGDFEDDLLLAAMERSQADYLVTNDEVLLRHSPVATLRPGELLLLLQA